MIDPTPPVPGGTVDPPMSRTARPRRRHRRGPPDRGRRSPPRSRELGRRIAADYAGRNLTLVSRAQGVAAVHGRPDAPDLAAAPDRPHGGQLLRRHGDRVVRPRPDHQGPVGEHRRRGRPARRGHHRHRADAQLPRPLPARQEPGVAPDLHAARQARPAAGRHPGRLRRASRSPTSSSSATGSTTASGTATSASWASCAPRYSTPSAPVMHRRPLGSGRRLALVGAIVLIVGCLLPWYVLGGDGGLPRQVVPRVRRHGHRRRSSRRSATLALVALPVRGRPGRWRSTAGSSYRGCSAIAALAGVALWLPERARRAGGPAAGPRLRLLDRRRWARSSWRAPRTTSRRSRRAADEAGAQASATGAAARATRPAIAMPAIGMVSRPRRASSTRIDLGAPELAARRAPRARRRSGPAASSAGAGARWPRRHPQLAQGVRLGRLEPAHGDRHRRIRRRSAHRRRARRPGGRSGADHRRAPADRRHDLGATTGANGIDGSSGPVAGPSTASTATRRPDRSSIAPGPRLDVAATPSAVGRAAGRVEPPAVGRPSGRTPSAARRRRRRAGAEWPAAHGRTARGAAVRRDGRRGRRPRA